MQILNYRHKGMAFLQRIKEEGRLWKNTLLNLPKSSPLLIVAIVLFALYLVVTYFCCPIFLAAITFKMILL